MSLKFNEYIKEGYSTLFNPQTGFFIRKEHTSWQEPFWSKHGPELIDISITSWCDKNCEFCYKSANKDGIFMSLEDFSIVVNQAKEMNVLQFAIGGGNPNQHPDFIEFLKLCYANDIVPNYSTNGRGLTYDILKASQKYCGAVAVSAYQPYDDFYDAVKKLTDSNIRTNVHFVLTPKTILTAIQWLSQLPKELEKIGAIVFLNFKPVGKAANSTLLSTSPYLKEFFELFNKHRTRPLIGVDSCLLSGVCTYSKVNSYFHDFCEAARFSMYISEDMKMYPCSFMLDKIEGIPINENNILEEWQINPVFSDMRNNIKLIIDNAKCPSKGKCSGCVIMPEINLCSMKCLGGK
jgi:MoaA/NifB/PqqE/SkfB family radical SAM enzyme